MIPDDTFVGFPKIARLSRECYITEKIDGTNAQIAILHERLEDGTLMENANRLAWFCGPDASCWGIYAGSRTRWITLKDDNHGFAAWVSNHVPELRQLGPGRHFGEWWGSGINRGYLLPKGEKRFSLFNVSRWCLSGQVPKPIPSADPRIVKWQDVLPSCCHLAPVLYRGIFTTDACEAALLRLKTLGSQASPGFNNPEGIVCFLVSANVGLKKTLNNDGAKSQ